jgi:hypothetical protein
MVAYRGMKISPALLGFIRGISFAALTAVLSYVGVAEHLSFLNPAIASLIAALALAAEHAIADNTGKALFGAARV